MRPTAWGSILLIFLLLKNFSVNYGATLKSSLVPLNLYIISDLGKWISSGRFTASPFLIKFFLRVILLGFLDKVGMYF